MYVIFFLYYYVSTIQRVIIMTKENSVVNYELSKQGLISFPFFVVPRTFVNIASLGDCASRVD